MIKREVRKSAWAGEQEVFINQDTGDEYRRIVGGLAWPYGKKPGYAVIVAEAMKEDPQLKDRPIWVIKEIEEPDILVLLRYCQDTQEPFMVQSWHGNTGDKAMMANFYHLSREQGQGRFTFRMAPYASKPNGLAHYMPIIKKYLAINRKILYLGQGSKLAGGLAQAGAEALSQNPSEYPPIAALGYALTYLYTVKLESPRQKKPKRKSSGWAD